MEPHADASRAPSRALGKQFPANDFTLLAVVLALPALGAFVNGLFGKRLGKDAVRFMALAALGGAFCAALVSVLMLPHGGHLTWTAWRWFSVTGRSGQPVPIDVAFSVDGMSTVMMLVVTGVGFLIHLYSSAYMREDAGYWRFFAYLNLFCFSMLVLIMASNLALLFVGWEGVGLCSYLLIGFWFEDDKNASAGRKAFVVNRIGDFGLICAMSMIVYYCGSLSLGAASPTTRATCSRFREGVAAREPLARDAARGRREPHPAGQAGHGVRVDALRAGAVPRVRGQERADPALRVAARRDGRPDARVRAHPRGDDGHRWRLPRRAALVRVRSCSPAALASRRRCTGAATALLPAASIGLFRRNDLKKVLRLLHG